MASDRWIVYGADCCGSWDIATFSDPREALTRLAQEREKQGPRELRGLWDEENPERGDIEERLEDTLAEAKEMEAVLQAECDERFAIADLHAKSYKVDLAAKGLSVDVDPETDKAGPFMKEAVWVWHGTLKVVGAAQVAQRVYGVV